MHITCACNGKTTKQCQYLISIGYDLHVKVYSVIAQRHLSSGTIESHTRYFALFKSELNKNKGIGQCTSKKHFPIENTSHTCSTRQKCPGAQVQIFQKHFYSRLKALLVLRDQTPSRWSRKHKMSDVNTVRWRIRKPHRSFVM